MAPYTTWRGAGRVLSGLGASLVALSLIFLVPQGAGAGADTSLSGFYLALGASASVGFQPTEASPNGESTDEGYANDVVAYEAQRGVTLVLSELGCPDETTTSMISGDDHCTHQDGSQLADATDFLRAHHDDEGIVTIDLGFNDLNFCLANTFVNASCVATMTSELQEELPYILESLEGAAGPGVTFVGVGHYDPYLAAAIKRRSSATFASQSANVIASLNDELSMIYANANISMASVSDYFDGQSHQRVRLKGVGLVPDNVAHICQLTWMCARGPYGPNVHPNSAGYLIIAEAIESQLSTPW